MRKLLIVVGEDAREAAASVHAAARRTNHNGPGAPDETEAGGDASGSLGIRTLVCFDPSMGAE